MSATRPSLRALLYAALFLIVSLSANAQSKVSSDGRVVISGHLSREVGEIPEEHNSGTAEKIEFLITVENRGAAPILNVHLDELKADGFVIVNRCWGANFNPDSCGKQTRGGPACAVPDADRDIAAGTIDIATLCPYLAPREVLTVWGGMVAQEAMSAHEILALVSWSEPASLLVPCKPGVTKNCSVAPQSIAAGKVVQVISLGRAEPIERWRYLVRRYTPKPEVLIPAALTALGFFFTWWAGRKQRQNEIWTTMLSEVHGFTMHYYMPMASMANAAAVATEAYCGSREQLKIEKDPAKIAELNAKATFQRRQGFYRLMMFHLWQRETFQKVGAYHLRTRMGEELVRILTTEHLHSLTKSEENPRRALERVKSVLVQETTLDDFLETLDSALDSDVTDCWKLFEKWTDGDQIAQDLATLEAYSGVLIYEVNLISDDWYRRKAKIDTPKRALNLLHEKASGLSFFASRLHWYLFLSRYAWVSRFWWIPAMLLVAWLLVHAYLLRGSWF